MRMDIDLGATTSESQQAPAEDVLPFLRDLSEGGGEEVLVCLYDTPRSWAPTLEVTYNSESDGSVDLRKLGDVLQQGNNRILKVGLYMDDDA
jgi:hypothetical protein